MIHYFFTVIIIAIATAMDAFSVGISMGMNYISKRRIFYIGVIIGIFHIIMPLLGMMTGHFLSSAFGEAAIYLASGLLLLIGIQMIKQSREEKDEKNQVPIGLSLLLVGFSVSLDSFSVAITLGMTGYHFIFVLICFGVFSMVLTWMGIYIGSKMKNLIGRYSVAFGGIILILISIKMFTQTLG